MVEWCKSRWFWTFPACSPAPPISPGEAPVFMGKSRLHFSLRGCIGHTENRQEWGTPVPNAAGAVTSRARRNAVLLSPTVRNSLRFMMQLSVLKSKHALLTVEIISPLFVIVFK